MSLAVPLKHICLILDDIQATKLNKNQETENIHTIVHIEESVYGSWLCGRILTHTLT